MSLISEALKKAQKMRTDPAAGAESTGDGGHVARRDRPMPAKTLALIVAGVAGLMVVVIAVTIIVVRRDAPPPQTAKSETTQPVGDGTTSATNPLSVASKPAPSEAQPGPIPSSHSAENTRPAAAAKPVPPLAAKNPATPAPPAVKADPRVQAFVDAVHVTGIRSSGADSKVLMNDRVFRLNDIVDRSLGVRLTEVRTDSLVFVDEHGFTYTKNF